MRELGKVDAVDAYARLEPLLEYGLTEPKPPLTAPLAGFTRLLVRFLIAMRMLLLGFVSFVGGTAAVAGFLLLALLLTTRILSHESVHFQRAIYFDYTEPKVVGSALFLREGEDGGLLATGSHTMARNAKFLQPGQVVGVWLELELPPDHPPVPIFQVLCELQALDGRVAARVSRPFVYRPPAAQRRWILGRTLSWARSWLSPWSWIWSNRRGSLQIVSVPLFDKYVEKAGTPVNVIKVAMQGRSGSGAVPEVTSASLHVQLQLGIIGRLLFKLRPGLGSMLLLVPLGLLAIFGGASVAIVAGFLCLYSLASATGGTRGGASTTAYETMSTTTGGPVTERAEGGHEVEDEEDDMDLTNLAGALGESSGDEDSSDPGGAEALAAGAVWAAASSPRMRSGSGVGVGVADGAGSSNYGLVRSRSGGSGSGRRRPQRARSYRSRSGSGSALNAALAAAKRPADGDSDDYGAYGSGEDVRGLGPDGSAWGKQGDVLEQGGRSGLGRSAGIGGGLHRRSSGKVTGQ